MQVDRTHTPWVIVAVHAPFYHTYLGHYKEVECMRQAYEPLLVRHQVDIVLSGHVHAYERTRPVVNYQVSCALLGMRQLVVLCDKGACALI